MTGESRPLRGRRYWRSLEELANTPEFRQWLEREFPAGASELLQSRSRRTLLKLMAASLGLAGLTGCRQPVEKILPLSRVPEGYVPGEPLHYATAFELGGVAAGLVVTAYDGRPVKVEGNPRHPASAGGSSAFAQASILSLYDPDRSQRVLWQGGRSSWEEFEKFAAEHFQRAAARQGEGLWLLSGYVSSPSWLALWQRVRERFPKVRWAFHEPVDREAVYRGTEIAFGERLEPHYWFDQARVIVALDADFLGVECLVPAWIGRFARSRNVEERGSQMSRLYAIESRFSATGAVADHRLAMRSGQVPVFALALARELGLPVEPVGDQGLDETARRWVQVIARDLIRARGASVILAGWGQPAEVHALVHWMNVQLGNAGQTVTYTQAAVQRGESSLKELADAARSGQVETLVIFGGNPVFTAPGNADVAGWLGKIPQSIYLGSEEDETTRLARWHLPQAHFLESWGDVRAPDGLASIQQPLIQPLFGGWSSLELLASIAGNPERRGYDIVRSFWTAQWPAAERERKWQQALREGLILASEFPPKAVTARPAEILKGLRALELVSEPIEIRFYPSPSIYDGRFANNGWLQELPDPMTKITWDNVALLAPSTAARLGVRNGEVIALELDGRSIQVPVWISPGQAPESIALEIGYGRAVCGRVGKGVGHNVYPLRSLERPWILTGIQVTRTGRKWKIACTQDHHAMEGRPLVREATLDEYQKHPDFAQHAVHHPPLESLYPSPASYEEGLQWGMVIDLNRCVGCNACVVACQAENNIPIVGKREVARGREMHWIRIDRYYEGEPQAPAAVFQPVTCHHCENAPCETVCPVAATVHNPEGLNVMVYNRCVGTRYCSNNCPYKVRRFNFFNWHKGLGELEKMVFNPEVTVRMRGVMEKCTYCVQRIERAKIRAKVEGRRALRDGEILTACQQACPAQAITFGSLTDASSRVARLKSLPRNYEMLAELNVRPRTSYLARVRNPNPELS